MQWTSNGYEKGGGLFGLLVLAVLLSSLRAEAGSLEEYQDEKHGSESSSDDDDSSSDDDDDDDDDDNDSVAGSILGEMISGMIESAVEGDHDEGTTDAGSEGPTETENCRHREFYNCRSRCDRVTRECRKACRSYASRLCGYGGASVARGSIGAPSQGTSGETGGATPFYHINWNRPSWLGEFGVGFGSNAAMLSTRTRVRWGHYGFGARASFLGSRNTWLLEGDAGPGFSWPIQSSVITLQPSAMLSAGLEDTTRLGGGLRFHLQYYGPRFMFLMTALGGYVPQPTAEAPGALNTNARLALGYRFTPTIYASLGYDFRLVEMLGDASNEWDPVQLHGGLFSVGFRLN